MPEISFALPDKVPVEKRFLIVRPVWEEAEDGADYGWLEVVNGPAPEKISYEYGVHAKIGVCSTISLTPASPIQQVSLFRKNLWQSENSADQRWDYHFAILVEHKERFKYLISYDPDFLKQLRFTFHEHEMTSILKGAEKEDLVEKIK